MEYKKSTFFDKYKIEPNLPKEKIRVLFQTDPTKRKELPIVIKTIGSDELLFIEELFTQHEKKELTKHKTILQNISTLNNKNLEKNISNISANLIKIIKKENYVDEFYYSKNLSQKTKEKCFDDFIECIVNKLIHEFINSIGESKESNIKIMYNDISKIFSSTESLKSKQELLDEELCDLLNNMLTMDLSITEISKKFKALLTLSKLVKEEHYKKSIIYTIEKISNDYDKYEDLFINCYDSIAKNLPNKNVKETSKNLSTLINRHMPILGNTKGQNLNSEYQKLKKIQKCCGIYHKFVKGKIEDEDFISSDNLCDFIVFAGKEWLEEYNNYLNRIIDDETPINIYNLVNHIITKNPSKTCLRIFTNIIIRNTNFDATLAYILEGHKETVDGTSDKYVSPKIVDEFIAKYYWIGLAKVLDDINETVFKNIQIIGFDILGIIENEFKLLQSGNLNYMTRMLIKDRIIQGYNLLPLNWHMDDGQTIRHFIDSIDGVCTGEDGVAEPYKKSYENIFRTYKKADYLYCNICGCILTEEEESCPKCNATFEKEETENDYYEDKEIENDYYDDEDEDEDEEIEYEHSSEIVRDYNNENPINNTSSSEEIPPEDIIIAIAIVLLVIIFSILLCS